MPIIVAITVVTFETIDVAVLVTTFWTPPMSFEMRDCTSPVRVRVKNASESRCRWRKTAVRRSCITRWPTWFESSVCQTPSTPVTIAITIIAAASIESCLVSLSLDRLQHAAQQERGRDAEDRGEDDQAEDGGEPERGSGGRGRRPAAGWRGGPRDPRAARAARRSQS